MVEGIQAVGVDSSKTLQDDASADRREAERRSPHVRVLKPTRPLTPQPFRALRGRRHVVLLNDDPVGRAFQMLRTQILLRMVRDGARTLAITSPHRGAGTSTVAVNLAISLSMEFDFTTLLVDANLRHPSLRWMLDLPPGPGLPECLGGIASLAEALHRPDEGTLVVLPGGAPLDQTAEILRSPMMVDLVREMRDRYPDRLIVFDAPPVLEGSDMLGFAPHVDAIVLVAEEASTSVQDIERACELLQDRTLLGVVLNKSREARYSHRSLFRRSRRRGGASSRRAKTLAPENLVVPASAPAVRTRSRVGWTAVFVLVTVLFLAVAALATAAFTGKDILVLLRQSATFDHGAV